MLLVVSNAFASKAAEITVESFEDKGTGVVFELDNEHRTATLVDGTEVKVVNYTVPAQVTKDGVTYTVTGIGDMAFYECENIETISLPRTVESIGNEAFEFSSLLSITLPEGVKNIGTLAFAESDIVSIILPASVKSIGDYAFDYCSDLASVIMGASLTEAGNCVFANCDKLHLAVIPSFEMPENPEAGSVTLAY